MKKKLDKYEELKDDTDWEAGLGIKKEKKKKNEITGKQTHQVTKNATLQKRLKNKDGIIESNSRLAEMYSFQKEYRKAIEYYETVLENVGDTNDSIRGNILPKLGGEYLKFNDYDTAAKYLLQGLRLNRKSK